MAIRYSETEVAKILKKSGRSLPSKPVVTGSILAALKTNSLRDTFIGYRKMIARDLPCMEEEHPFDETRNWKFDFALRKYKIGIECDGQVHAISSKREEDAEKRNTAHIAGWIVIVVTKGWMYNNPETVFNWIREALRVRGWHG